jgi:FHS family L-fucose permease-like MFS transporter
MFWPAAQAEKYGLFLAALFVIASGLSFLETAANPFIAQLGSPSSSARRLNFSQAFYPLGAIAAGLVGTVFIFSGVKLTGAQVVAMQAAGTYRAYLHAETLRVLMPYVVLGAVAFFWALLVVLTKFPPLGSEDVSQETGIKPAHVKLFQRHFVFAVIAQFLYVGAQVGTWSWFIQYVESATGVGDKAAGYMLTGTLAAFAVGRFSSAWLLHHIPARLMLGVYAAVNVVLGLVAVTRQNWLGVGCLLTTSLFMSMMFPTIFVLGIKGMGDKTKTAGSLLIMAIMGGALLPKLMGIVADARGLQTAYLVPVVCFAAIGLYAWLGAERKAASQRVSKSAS